MHPSARIICWLVLVLTAQALSGTGCALGFAIVLTQGKPVLAHGWKLIRRSRILLVSLWLILAYSLPGDTWQDYPWLPSYPGITEANLHTARLCLVLASLAWLLTRLSHTQLVAGLWYLLRPFRSLGIDVDRMVVRLSLVLEYLQHQPPQAHWRDLLNALPEATSGEDKLTIHLPSWHAKDSLGFGLCLMLSLILWRL